MRSNVRRSKHSPSIETAYTRMAAKSVEPNLNFWLHAIREQSALRDQHGNPKTKDKRIIVNGEKEKKHASESCNRN